VVAALHSAKLEPGRLELEITEGVLLSDEGGTLETLNELRSLEAVMNLRRRQRPASS
jgi:EAL domain-containing protein (putative c-di-GMP-specific phosphodiesterase class I)